jgi:hypothetical protein
MVPHPGLNCQAEVRLPDQGSAKTKNDHLTIIAEERSLASAAGLGTQPHTPLSRGSTTDSALNKVLPVLVSPEDAVDRFVAANTRPPEAGRLPAALRREIFNTLYARE